MEKIKLTKSQVRRYLIRYHHLTADTELRGDDAVVDFVRRVGCIQYDPLDVVGRNPDLVLQARSAAYRKGDIDRLLYEQRRLFDAWDKNMSICAVEDWPYLARNRRQMGEAYLGALGPKLAEAVETVRLHLLENEYATSSDFELEGWIDWYGRHRIAKAALEYMGYAGQAVVHHKKGTRRHFCLAERFIPACLFEAPNPNESDDVHYEWLVRRRMNGIGLLWNRGGDAWLGTLDFKSEHRNRGFEALIDGDRVAEVRVEGVGHPFYIDRDNLPLLENALPVPEENVRILAPLDNMLWERKLLLEMFDFDYRWEVYVPAAKRKYGYYVLPVLCGERLVGRIEMATEKSGNKGAARAAGKCENREKVPKGGKKAPPSTRRLTVKSFWWEEGVGDKRALARHIREGIRRFADYNLCGKIVYQGKL